MDVKALERRCPRLGGPVCFSYCLSCENTNRTCGKVFDCWWERFDVVSYLQQHLPVDAYQRLCERRPKPKLTSLVEMIQQAQANARAEKRDTAS